MAGTIALCTAVVPRIFIYIYMTRYISVSNSKGCWLIGSGSSEAFVCMFFVASSGEHPLALMFVSLEGYLEDSVTKGVAIEWLDGHDSLIIVSHCNETKALALIGLKIPDDLNVLNSTEGSKQLPKDVLLGLGSQIVDEQTPAGAVEGGAR